MTSKNFISLFFLGNKLQLVFLSNDKKTVKKFVTFPVPVGIIVNNKVQDTKKLAELVKGIWKKLNLKQKYVGIIVPEFSTYIKSLVLPKIEVDDLDEAIRWQAADLLPSKENLILDWKILGSTDKTYTILIVSIKKDILTGYVDSCGLAGLYPIIVETPSVSLSRLTNTRSLGGVLVYNKEDEALVVVGYGENIYGSSIVPSGDQSILLTAKKITGYYDEVKIEKIWVGGINLSKGLFDELEKQYKAKPEWLITKVGGVSPNQIQEYLVPISLSLKDAKEPRDENSINLLPINWVEGYEKRRFKKQLGSLLINALLVLVTILMLTVGFYFSFDNQLKKLVNEAVVVEGSDEVIVDQVAAINTLVKDADKALSNSYSVSDVLGPIGQLDKEGLQITSYTLNFDTGDISIKGVAASRLSLINFKESIESLEDFSSIKIPLSVLENEADFIFQINFIYLPAAVKKSPGVMQLIPM